jgi:hypothetical protein
LAGVSTHGCSMVASRRLDLFQQPPGAPVGEWDGGKHCGVEVVPFGIDATTGLEHWPDTETTAFRVRLS